MREVLMNEKTNLLQLEEHFYQLVDVDEPNTFRNLFPYSEVPKIAFNDRIVPHNMPEDIWDYRYYIQRWPAVESTIHDGADCYHL